MAAKNRNLYISGSTPVLALISALETLLMRSSNALYLLTDLHQIALKLQA